MGGFAVLMAADLMWRSKVAAAAARAGLACRTVDSVEALRALAGEADLVLIDLHHPHVDPLAAIRAAKGGAGATCVVAFGHHTDAARLRAAREAGADEAVPNSGLEARVASWAP